MKPTLRTRKPVDKLRLEDIKAFPVWEFANDEEGIPGQDETWVRPIRTKVVPAGAYSLTVAARFKSSSGIAFHGLVGISTSGSLHVSHAAVLTETDFVFIPWPGYAGARQSCAAAARQLGLPESALFPLDYEVLAPVQGIKGPVRGRYTYSDASQETPSK
jgi:hypothetical protein